MSLKADVWGDDQDEQAYSCGCGLCFEHGVFTVPMTIRQSNAGRRGP
jgi:hypothetical protein